MSAIAIALAVLPLVTKVIVPLIRGAEKAFPVGDGDVKKDIVVAGATAGLTKAMEDGHITKDDIPIFVELILGVLKDTGTLHRESPGTVVVEPGVPVPVIPGAPVVIPSPVRSVRLIGQLEYI